MRMFNTEGLTREALQEVYEIVLTQKLVQEEKLNRLKQELAVAICAIEDGKVTDVQQIKTGLTNLFIYIETHLKLPDILNVEKHEELIKLDEQLTRDLCLEQIQKKVKEEKVLQTMAPPSELKKGLHVVE